MSSINSKFGGSLLDCVNVLPYELIDIIKEFANPIVFLFTNKTYYHKHHAKIKYLLKDRYDSYVRDMIRRDNDFSINQIINDNISFWKREHKKYYYNNFVYSSYINFLIEYSNEQNSTKCYNLLRNIQKINGYNKNKHKKKIEINGRWKI